MRYSDGKPAIDGRAKVFWEYAVPEMPFWNDLPFTVERKSLCHYPDIEILSLPIDPGSSLSEVDKLQLLEELLITRLAAKEVSHRHFMMRITKVRMVCGWEFLNCRNDYEDHRQGQR